MIANLSPGKVLRALLWLRFFAIFGQIVVLLVSREWLLMDLQYIDILSTSLFLMLWNISLYWRLKKPWAITQAEVFLNIVIDTSALAFILYWAGGATNPFVSLLLVPVAIAAAALSTRYVVAVSSLCIIFYSLLMIFYLPMPPALESFWNAFNLHIFGMWVNFILSTALMAIFVASIANTVRRKQISLSKAREEALMNEKIVAMGILATGVAHEINTPLSTMSMLVDEIQAQPAQNSSVYEDLDSIKNQINICSERISVLLDNAGHGSCEGGQAIELRSFLEKLLNHWKIVRPEVLLDLNDEALLFNPIIYADHTISQSISNLLNNAADASIGNKSKNVSITMKSRENQLRIWIDDEGRGISQDQIERAGHVIYSGKDKGFGIGLVLSNASLNRFKGKIVYKNKPQGGTRTEISLPLKDLIIDVPTH